jgi:3-isopropylmalate/(R)-2-methylmalate dehydratase large subunit
MTKIEEITGSREGNVATLHPDLVLISNGFSHLVTGITKGVRDPEKVVVVYDHNVPAGLPEESKVFEEILAFAKGHGIAFRQAKGIGEKWLLEEGRVKEGTIALGGTRHLSVFGSVGAMGLGLSHTELARVLESGTYQMIVPETVRVAVKGKLSENAGYVDAALSFLRDNRDIAGKSVEFVLPGAPQHLKEVLCEMAVDTGAFTAFAVEEGKADRTLDLTGVTPMLRLPCNSLFQQKEAGFGDAKKLELTGIQAGQLGGITGGAIEDLRKAAECMRGKRIRRGFRLSICPATSATYLKALEEGLIEVFLDFGAQIEAAGDRDIVPQGAGALGHGEKLLTTGLYTYPGAMGCQDAAIYTASPETILSAALAE